MFKDIHIFLETDAEREEVRRFFKELQNLAEDKFLKPSYEQRGGTIKIQVRVEELSDGIRLNKLDEIFKKSAQKAGIHISHWDF